MSQITMVNTYESNYYGQYIWVKLLWVIDMSQMSQILWVIHMCQITMGNTMSQITTGNKY